MTVVVLTFNASADEISSGIPKHVSITSNIPSTIYYTIDGSTPTTDSPIYAETIDFPTGYTSITLSAFGVDSEYNAGPILTQFFAADTTRITISRNIGAEGIVINRAEFGQDISTGFDADNTAARFVDVDPANLTFLQSRGYQGIYTGTIVDVNIPLPENTPSFLDDNFQGYSTPEKAEIFNPNALYIVIDNRINNDVNIMPRPYGSLNNVYKEFGGKRVRNSADDAAYVSGGFVKRFYDQRNGVMVSYYFDHNESRYIKNIQELPSYVPPITSAAVGPMPLVFQWIEFGRHSSFV